MNKKIVSVLILSILLSGCILLNRSGVPTLSITPVIYFTETETESPTQTPAPTSTVTLTPTADLGSVGLPTEAPGTTALDFSTTMCSAQWFNRNGQLPCPGSADSPNAGYVVSVGGSSLGMLLTYPPQDSFETIFSKYPPFIVQSGDRFRTVLSCKAHTFCDVMFSLEYFDSHGKNGLANWPYRFSSSPVVIDFPLQGIAGKTVQFGLSVRGNGNRLEAYAVWIYPHIYRPNP